MNIQVSQHGPVRVVSPQGRLDAFGAKSLAQALGPALDAQTLFVVLDLSNVHYLSSAGVRVFVSCSRELGARAGSLVLSGVQAYAFDVLALSGLADAFLRFDHVDQALKHARPLAQDQARRNAWDTYPVYQTPAGTARVIPGSDEPGVVHLIGNVKDVLEASLTADDIASKSFDSARYSLGLGALGESLEDYLGIMGEMMTIGGTMVWLPTDGNDTPDFLIPRADVANQVQMRVGFNASIHGAFNELIYFQASQPQGVTLTDLYRALFDLAKTRPVPFKGALALAMRAQLGGLMGSGVTRSPIHRNKPGNGKLIVDPTNVRDWFESDKSPRHVNSTGLLCGIGVDLTADLSGLDQDMLDSAFWVHPDNAGTQTQLLHNHATVFPRIGFSTPRPVNLETELAHVLDNSEFLDMRHLLDGTTIQEALIGVSYVQAIEPDPHARPWEE